VAAPPKGEPQRIEHPLPPVVYPDARVLLLGTMPSPKSREFGFHYGHPQNRFWRVLAGLWGEDVPPTVQGKRDLCRRRHVAIDATLLACAIIGASDASIRDPVPNDLSRVLGVAPGIRAVFCTGGTAARMYRRYVEPLVGMPCVQLPSTSPANARWRLEDLLVAYACVREAADGE
jgi:hypoxanthine-DNA glycosylase